MAAAALSRCGRLLPPLLPLSLLISLATLSPVCVAQPTDWNNWESFRQRYIQFDGRVTEHEFNARTTSEAQAYSLFFALVNNDPSLFALLLEWTENNLANGDLGTRLPGWLWGQATEPVSGTELMPRWRLLDENSASDADLWIAYTLLEAGRLWQVSRYHALGMTLLRQISQKEVLRLPDGGVILLPGQRGFQIAEHRWRINPSYFVPQQFALFARADPSGPWSLLVNQLSVMMSDCCPSGYAPDWVVYHEGSGWKTDKESRATGSYDAIRVYLWAGMMDSRQPGRRQLLEALHGMHTRLQRRGEAPERVDVTSGKGSGKSPPGHVAALIPFLDALDEKALLAHSLQQLRALESEGLSGRRQRYYDQVLALFGLGYIERRFRFSPCGELLTAWSRLSPECRGQNTAENASPP